MKGNIFTFFLDPGTSHVQLPDGYSYSGIIFTYLENTQYTNNTNIITNMEYTFPVIDSKSHCTFDFAAMNTSKRIVARGMITKMGQIPDIHYFDTDFSPILVTGSDGNEYNVIPSDQFK